MVALLLWLTIVNIPERTYTQNVTVNSAKINIEATSPGWSIMLTCDKWDATTEGNIQVIVEFTPGNPTMLAQYNFKGRGTDRITGLPLNTVMITGAWPMATAGIQRGQNVTASMNPITNVTTAITVNTSVAALRQAPARRRIPVPRRPRVEKK